MENYERKFLELQLNYNFQKRVRQLEIQNALSTNVVITTAKHTETCKPVSQTPITLTDKAQRQNNSHLQFNCFWDFITYLNSIFLMVGANRIECTTFNELDKVTMKIFALN